MTTRTPRAIALAAALAVTGAGAVTVDQTAPDFTLSTHDGGTFHLAAETGNVVVLFFFGCT